MINIDTLVVNSLFKGNKDILFGTREVPNMISDNKVILNSSKFSTTLTSVNRITNIDGMNSTGSVTVQVYSVDMEEFDFTAFIGITGGYTPNFISKEGNVYTISFNFVNTNNFEIINLNVYEITKINCYVYIGEMLVGVYSNELLPFNKETVLTEVPWVSVKPKATILDSSFEEILNYTLVDNTLMDIELPLNSFLSVDKESFTKVVNVLDGDSVLSDISGFYDGITEKVLEVSDIRKINFVKDFRNGDYSYGLKDALLKETESSIIYGLVDDEIIVDAGVGGKFIIGNMFTDGNSGEIDKTDKFEVHTSNDGTNWTKIYENTSVLSVQKLHTMTGQGRFFKIVFKSITEGYGRIITNVTNGKFWDLKIVHPISKLYKFDTILVIDNKNIEPDFIEYFDNLNKRVVQYKQTPVSGYSLDIVSEKVTSLELDLWTRIKEYN